MATIIECTNTKVDLISESCCVSGGRAGIKNERGYTHIEVTADIDNNEYQIALLDNITDVDGHWSDIGLSPTQFCEFIEGLISLQNHYRLKD